jgi:hypothetical protein
MQWSQRCFKSAHTLYMHFRGVRWASMPAKGCEVDEYISCRVCLCGLRHTALQGDGHLLPAKEHLLEASRIARLHHARHRGGFSPCKSCSIMVPSVLLRQDGLVSLQDLITSSIKDEIFQCTCPTKVHLVCIQGACVFAAWEPAPCLPHRKSKSSMRWTGFCFQL